MISSPLTKQLRQGDHISHYLYVICMDKLFHLINEAVDRGKWDSMRGGRMGHILSHLMFVDDLLVFGKSIEKKMVCVIDVLNKFCAMSS